MTRKQLRAIGLTDDQIDRMVRNGRLERVHRSVFAIAGCPPSWLADELAACRAAEGGVASHRAALKLWDVALGPEVPVEISVTRPHSPELVGVITHRSTDLLPAHVCTRSAIPVTNPLRTLVDLGAVVPDYWVARALEVFVVRKLVTVEGVQRFRDEVGRRGRRGAGVLRRVLAEWYLGARPPDSVIEPEFARICARFGLPQAIFQHEVRVGGRRRRIDFAYPDVRIAIEIDGFETRVDLDVFRDERRRQNDLVGAGWTVYRFTWYDLKFRPDYVAGVLTSVLGPQVGRRAG